MTILVVRLSALGDVALLYPEIYALLSAHPNLKVVLLTRKSMRPLFEHLENVEVVCPDLQGRHKGFIGLWRLFLDLKIYKIKFVADVHGVLRSRILSMFFRIQGARISRIDKQRAERKDLTRRENKEHKPLLSAGQRYRNVFAKLGFSYENVSFPPILKADISKKHGVGVAPFAGFHQKEWPWEKVVVLVRQLSELGIEVWLFGAPGEQREKLKELTAMQGVFLAEFSGGMKDELRKMASLQCMLSMDSANGHLASLVHCPVVCVWGATHRNFGFSPVGEVTHVEVDLDELPCRPCSAFGAKPCYRGDLACLNTLEVAPVLQAIKNYTS